MSECTPGNVAVCPPCVVATELHSRGTSTLRQLHFLLHEIYYWIFLCAGHLMVFIRFLSTKRQRNKSELVMY